MKAYVSYSDRLNRGPDFIVKYVRTDDVQAGLRIILTQGVRSDFRYFGDAPERCFMIHPEFLDDNKNVISDFSEVADSGYASMWILEDASREYHKSRISRNVKGFMVVGHQVIAEVIVVDGFDLLGQPS
jgi:hypothetical protein